MKEKDPVFIKEDDYLAHVNPETKAKQSLSEHLNATAFLGDRNCPLQELKNIIKVTALLHDAGKLGQDFFEYMNDILEYGEDAGKRQIDHSSAGGRIIEAMTGGCFLSDLVGTVIYSHHGIQDCIDMNTGKTLSEKRWEKEGDLETIKERYFQFVDKSLLTEYIRAAHFDTQKIIRRIKEFLDVNKGKNCGSREFYFGMYERLLLSLLIDSDWSDTACFMEGEALPERLTEERTQQIWEECLCNFENYMEQLKGLGDESPLNIYREEISERCYQASKDGRNLYRLTVPTGAGKTLSGLRFALNHAKQYKKRHIFYVAPYTSILEQNADEIRKAVGREEYVLEHHSNVCYEEDDEEERYRRLTENWDCTLIATTAVQMLNTLFSGQKISIRRMYNLCNSVIIFDEVQAFPLRGTELFNLAVNFLTVFCNTTVVLCSATQPSLAQLKENNLHDCKEMAGDVIRYAEAFRRVEFEDMTDLVPGGMKEENLCDFAIKEFESYRSVLIIVNTKSCAKKVYELLKERCTDECGLYHLSTNMCPENRSEELELIKRDLKTGRPVICVSTQLIEAGVNVSFGCVIRSLAGMDSIIQAAGRCNRHKSQAIGKVYIIKMDQDVENLKWLEDIRRARDASETFFYYFNQNPKEFGGAMDSEKAVTAYYRIFFHANSEATKYLSSIQETTLEELLGKNRTGLLQYKRCHNGETRKSYLNQAFQTAGKDYKVIPEDEKVAVVIPYDQTAETAIAALSDQRASFAERRRAIRKLQRYTVGIAPWKKEELGNAVYSPEGTGIYVLSMDYYDKKEGVLDAPRNRFLNY